MIVCHICNTNIKNLNSFSKHLSVHKNISKKDYYDTFFLKNIKDKLCPRCNKNERVFKNFKYLKLCYSCENTQNRNNKYCSICKIEKNINDFSFRKDQKRYLSICKDCSNKKKKAWAKTNTEKVYLINKKYRKKLGKDKTNSYARKYTLNKRKNNTRYCFWVKMRNCVYRFLKNIDKPESTKNLLGYSYEDFKNFMLNNPDRIQQTYSFNDYHKGILTLDHIIPLSFFIKDKINFIKANSLNNLRLITLKENTRKKNKIDLGLIEKFNLDDLYKSQLYSEIT